MLTMASCCRNGMSSSTVVFVIFVCFVLTIGVGLKGNMVQGKPLKKQKLSDSSVDDNFPDNYDETKAGDIYNNDVSALSNHTTNSDDYWQVDPAGTGSPAENETKYSPLNFTSNQNNTDDSFFGYFGSTNNTWFPNNETDSYNQSSLQFDNIAADNSSELALAQNVSLTNNTENYFQSNLTSGSRQNLTYFNLNSTLGIPNSTNILTLPQNDTVFKTGPQFIGMPVSTQTSATNVPTATPVTTWSDQTTTLPPVSTTTQVSTTQFASTPVTTTGSTPSPLFPVTGTTLVSTQSTAVTGDVSSSTVPTANYNKPTEFTFPPSVDEFSSSNSIDSGSTTTGFPQDTTVSTTIAYINGLQNYLNQKDKHYVTSVLIPVAAGIFGALFLVCVAYSVKTCGKKRQYTQMNSMHSDQDSQRSSISRYRTPRDMQRPTTDRMMLLADSSDEDFTQW